MSATADHTIATVDALREVVAPPSDGVKMKLGDRLDEFARDFIAECPFLVLATASADGKADASPKGDDPGFVVVEDDHTLVIPDRPGNNLAFGLTNIIETGQVGLLFIIPGTTETLRVNGRAELSRDPRAARGPGRPGQARRRWPSGSTWRRSSSTAPRPSSAPSSGSTRPGRPRRRSASAPCSPPSSTPPTTRPSSTLIDDVHRRELPHHPLVLGVAFSRSGTRNPRSGVGTRGQLCEVSADR